MRWSDMLKLRARNPGALQQATPCFQMQGIFCLGLAGFKPPSECVLEESVLKSGRFTLPKPGDS